MRSLFYPEKSMYVHPYSLCFILYTMQNSYHDIKLLIPGYKILAILPTSKTFFHRLALLKGPHSLNVGKNVEKKNIYT